MKPNFICNLVCINSQYVHSSLAPWCLLAGIRQYAREGVCAFVTEGTVNEDEERLLERICARDWDVVGFCCYIWNITLVRRLCRTLKERYPHRTVVLGGPEVGFTPRETLEECPQADYVLTGAGEKSIAMLCNCLADRAPVRVAGCTSREHSLPPESPATPPSPYTEEYFSALGGRIAYLETMRGCPYSCAFCLSGREEELQFFPVERVKRELLSLGNSGTKTIKLVDRSFNADPKRAAEIVRFLIENRWQFPSDLCIHFEIEGMTLTRELTELFCSAPAGFFRLEVGVQSTNPRSLRAVCRREGANKRMDGMDRLVKSKVLTVHADLIVGLPYEDSASFRESFNRLFAVRPHEIQVGFLKILKGTPMRDGERFPCTYSSEPPYEVLETPWLKRDEIAFLKELAHTVEKVYNSGKFALTLAQAIPLFETPFDFFASFCAYCRGKDRRHDTYTDRLFLFLSEHGMEEAEARDLLVQDRLAACAPNLSPCLKAVERGGQRPKKLLQQRLGPPQGRRGAAWLWKKPQIVFCDYDQGPYCQKDPVSGRYRLFYLER